MNKVFGYIFISLVEQHSTISERQLDGIKCDIVFKDDGAIASKHRPQLSLLIKTVKSGDKIVINSMDVVANSLVDLRNFISSLIKKDIEVSFVREHLTFTSDTDTKNQAALKLLNELTNFTIAIFKQKQREGIIKSKNQGNLHGGLANITDEEIELVIRMVHDRYKKTEIAKKFNISRQTIYRIIGKYTVS